MYTDDSRQHVEMFFQLTSGWTAAIRGNAPPPNERFEENPMRDERINAIELRVLPLIANRIRDATYEPEL
jgi:hypothetical protein